MQEVGLHSGERLYRTNQAATNALTHSLTTRPGRWAAPMSRPLRSLRRLRSYDRSVRVVELVTSKNETVTLRPPVVRQSSAVSTPPSARTAAPFVAEDSGLAR